MDNDPIEINLNVVKEDDWDQSFRFRKLPSNDLHNVTGWTGKAQVRNPLTDVLLVEMTVTINQATAPGIVMLSLTKTQTGAMAVGKYRYDLELTISGKKRTWLKGDFEVLPQVTHT